MKKPPKLLVYILLLLATCSRAYNKNDVTHLRNVNKDFAFRLTRQVIKDGRWKNTVLSPFSLSLALGMLYRAAKGNTRSQIGVMAGFDTVPSRMDQTFKDIRLEVYQYDRNYTSMAVNSVFYAEGTPVTYTYMSETLDCYGIPLQKMDFKADATESTQLMNGWAEDASSGLISDIVPRFAVHSDTKLISVSGNYFDGHWATAFDPAETVYSSFTINVTHQKDVPMMHSKGYFNYFRDIDNKFQILEIPYQNEDISMFFVLPDQLQAIDALILQLHVDYLNSILANMQSTLVEVTVPKFSVSQTLSMKHILLSLGIQDVFIRDKADLSGIDSTRNLFLTDIFQQTHFNVSESGLKSPNKHFQGGSKIAAINMKKFIADKPFLFFIREESTGTILHIGNIGDPTVHTVTNIKYYYTSEASSVGLVWSITGLYMFLHAWTTLTK